MKLSIALAKAGVEVSYISTPKNIQRLPPIPSNLHTLIHFVEFPFPILQHESIPEGSEATTDLPTSKVEILKTAYDLLQHPLKQFVANQKKPDWIIIDVIPHWMADIAKENQVPLLFFSVFSASSYRVEGKIDAFKSVYEANVSVDTDVGRVSKVLNSCQAMAIRSCTVVEGDYMEQIHQVIGKPVIPVGLLPPKKPESKSREMNVGSWSETFKWLDQQKPKSVIYVAFGSEYMLTKDEVFEIAYGLELSGLPFLWALRKPVWAKDDLDALPNGFSDRTYGQGVVSIGWAPQMEILGHSSIGGSLFHSGWGSIIETLQFGHCLVLLPFMLDQPLNARLMVEKGLGVEVERKEDGSFTRDGISKALTTAMVSNESQNLRERVSKAAEVFGNEKLHQDYYIVNFVEFLKIKEY